METIVCPVKSSKQSRKSFCVIYTSWEMLWKVTERITLCSSAPALSSYGDINTPLGTNQTRMLRIPQLFPRICWFTSKPDTSVSLASTIFTNLSGKFFVSSFCRHPPSLCILCLGFLCQSLCSCWTVQFWPNTGGSRSNRTKNRAIFF